MRKRTKKLLALAGVGAAAVAGLAIYSSRGGALPFAQTSAPVAAPTPAVNPNIVFTPQPAPPPRVHGGIPPNTKVTGYLRPGFYRDLF